MPPEFGNWTAQGSLVKEGFEGGVGDDDPRRNGDAEIQQASEVGCLVSALSNITGLTERNNERTRGRRGRGFHREEICFHVLTPAWV